MSASSKARSWAILRQRLLADVASLPLVWGLFALGVALLVGGFALFRGAALQSSAWEQAAQIARWYAGGVGVYATAVHLPNYLAHGHTRREYAAQVPAFVLAFAAGWALLMTVGYALETLAYRAFGWQQTITGTHLFDSPTAYPLILVEFLLVGTVWTVAGAVLGGAFYRNTLLGLGLVPVALAMVGLVEAAAGPSYFGPLPAAWAEATPVLGSVIAADEPVTAALVTAGVFALGLVLAWALIRDLPIRTRTG